MNKTYTWTIFSLILTACMACSDEQKLITGENYPYREGMQTVSSVLLPLEEGYIYRTDPAAKDGIYLHVGQFENYSSSILMRFGRLPQRATVIEAAIGMSVHRTYKEEGGQIEVTVHEILNDWSEENYQTIDVNPVPDTSFTVTELDTLDEIITLSNTLVQKWLDDTTKAYGVRIDFTGQGIMKEYYSVEGSFNTFLALKYRLNNDEKEETRYPRDDISLLQADVDPIPGSYLVDNFSGWRTVLKFAVPDIPANATINMASLRLVSKQAPSLFNDFQLNTIGAYLIYNDPWTGHEEPQIDDLFFQSGTLEDNTDNTVNTIQINALVQQWTSNNTGNAGVVLRSLNEGVYIGRYFFHDITADSTFAPTLEIFYTNPPGTR